MKKPDKRHQNSGRPPIEPDKKKTVRRAYKFTAAVAAQIRANAKAAGRNETNYVEWMCGRPPTE
jgi:hypothetical protein